MATFDQLTGIYLDHELHSADSTTLFTTPRRNQAINDGAAEFAELTECLLRQSTIACSCNTQEYDLLQSTTLGSTDFVRIAPRGVEYHLRSSGAGNQFTQLAGDDFPRRDQEWLNQYEPGWRTSTTPQMPTGYYVDERNGGFRIGLDYPPNIGSSELGTLLVPYIARPALMTASTDVPFTIAGNVRTDLIPFHMALVHYAAHQLEKLRGDEEASDRQQAKYLSYVQRYTEKIRKRGGTFVKMAKQYLRVRRGSGYASDRYDYYRRGFW